MMERMNKEQEQVEAQCLHFPQGVCVLHIFVFVHMLCDRTVPGGTYTYVSSPQAGSLQQIKVWIPPQSNLVNQWVL